MAKKKSSNSGVDGAGGYEFQKHCALYIFLEQYNDIKDTDRIIKVGVDHIGSDKHHFFEEHNYSYPEMYFYTKKSFTIKIS